MVAAMKGDFDHMVDRVIIIDCRYPYEFEGGHIRVSLQDLECPFYPKLHEHDLNSGPVSL